MDVDVPLTLLQEVDELVLLGAFSSREVAISELLRLGLDTLKARPRSGPFPARPPIPPGVRDPHEDEPITVDPSDVNWMA